MIYRIENATVSLGGNVILDRIDFEIRNKNEKIAVVGRNGSGKTTLLKLILGETEADHIDGVETRIISVSDPTIGYLKQSAFDDIEKTLDEEIAKVFEKFVSMKNTLDEMTLRLESEHDESLVSEYTRLLEEYKESGGYYYRKEYDILLKNFGFSQDDRKKRLKEFSGGERTKLAFIKLLLTKPDILLLDEPTNHLDITTLEWLEKYLKVYPHAVVVVSHDRMFLDRIADTVYEIEHHHIKRYGGNYTDFARQKREAYDKQLKDHLRQQKEIERLEGIAKRFIGKPTKVSMARSKLKAIEHMDIIDAPDAYDTKTFNLDFKPAKEPGKDILFVKDLSFGYDEVIQTVSFDIKRGERIGIIGGNGLGKSTLLKTITGIIEPLSGSVSFGTNVQTGYFDQQMSEYVSGKTVMDDFHDEYPSYTQTEVRNCLGAFLFTQDEVFKEVKSLSGGEKVRLALCKIINRKPNFLILDEPTNHMDIASKEALEEMLTQYEGTVLFVSHDRYFVKKTATSVMLIERDGMKLCRFGYDQYEEEQERLKKSEDPENDIFAMRGNVISAGNNGKQDAGRLTGTVQKEAGSAQLSYEALKEASRRDKKIKKLEAEIEQCEAQIEEKKEKLSLPENATDYVKLADIQNEIDLLEERLLKIMEEWDELNALT
ncbi:MAG: ABC-F family ATP-binding cassette domain-containing protein [Lachnospiraceae bacterium]|nr:ABC-F family ATP-binding cassette domain-containing protein [Lachnospiraceae bacterium]